MPHGLTHRRSQRLMRTRMDLRTTAQVIGHGAAQATNRDSTHSAPGQSRPLISTCPVGTTANCPIEPPALAMPIAVLR